MRNKADLVNIDKSDLANYPNGRIKNNTGAGDGTPVNEIVYGDIHEAKDKLMRDYGIAYNGLPDNVTNGYQLVDALVALASKNDFILNLTDVSGVINVNVKLGFLKTNESFIAKSGFNKGAQTVIKGTDGATKSITFIGDFKTNEYVRMINTGSGVTLIRLVDSVNADTFINELGYLKKATDAEVIAGVLNNVAVTPESFKAAFTDYVNGTNSDDYLATALRDGLLSKEDKVILNGLDNPVKNVGGFSGLDVGGGTVGATYPVFGDIVSATKEFSSADASVIKLVLANTMDDTDYFVRVHLKSETSGAPSFERTVLVPSTKEYTTTSFEFQIREIESVTQNLRVFFEVVKL